MSDYADQARRVAEGIRAVIRFDEALAILLVYEERVRAEERDLAAMIAQGVTHDPQCEEGYRCCRCRAEAAEAEVQQLATERQRLFDSGLEIARERDGAREQGRRAGLEEAAKLMAGTPGSWQAPPFCKLSEHVQEMCECAERAEAIRALVREEPKR